MTERVQFGPFVAPDAASTGFGPDAVVHAMKQKLLPPNPKAKRLDGGSHAIGLSLE